MTQSVRAVFERGVLRLLEPVSLQENQHVTVTLNGSENGDAADADFLRSIEVDADDNVSLTQVRRSLAKIPGSMSDEFRRERDERS